MLAELRAPFRGRSTPVNAWWGSFDVAVSLWSPDGVEVAVGWWPGDERYPRAAFYAYAKPSPPGFAEAGIAQWHDELGEYLLDWDDVRSAPDPHAAALAFGRAAVRAAGLEPD